jgi:hypothetical protein
MVRFLVPVPVPASRFGAPWRRHVYSSPDTLFHELTTLFCVRNTSQHAILKFASGLEGDRSSERRSLSASARHRLRNRMSRQGHRLAASDKVALNSEKHTEKKWRLF